MLAPHLGKIFLQRIPLIDLPSGKYGKFGRYLPKP
jgi:hypothetical protein